ncbi:hypothetical protein XM38_038200 [Halomicronema hongdechloris C2206]|uniref:Uncharacterized protein n=1 Tax=Halomicronema hongdechloris C2206 TaxID=1641165 RepID=A0A1Z3HRB6_9CYAN|nr:hypothetical protein [Halomicronema hongdechloris]ASC72860.1 hypothetical protein XM38_038200 [Halomicronema hongdechloris C2206]
MALGYGWLALGLRLGTATAWTGALTLGTAVLALEVGRQQGWRWLQWLALAGLSLGWYELILYQMLQADSGELGDALVVLAAVAVVIMAIYYRQRPLS